MTKSILSDEKKCYICGRTANLHRHHIYAGFNRKHSEKYGCVCYLCAEHHNMSDFAVHSNHDLDIALKQACQKKFEELYSHEEFMKVFGRNYL